MIGFIVSKSTVASLGDGQEKTKVKAGSGTYCEEAGALDQERDGGGSGTRGHRAWIWDFY